MKYGLRKDKVRIWCTKDFHYILKVKNRVTGVDTPPPNKLPRSK